MQAFALVLLCSLTMSAHAADAPKDQPKPATTIDELDKRLAKLFGDAKIPGASVTIIENSQVAFTKGYGFADLKSKAPVTPDTVFRAGSISKSFTSIGIMMLVEEGKLNLDAKLADLMPELKYENEWESTHPIRLAHLLEHTTGFNDIEFRHYLLEGKDIPLSKAVDLYGPYKSRWQPGTRMSYCNAGPVIAGRIIEKVTGQKFQEFMATRLTGPLAMESAFWTLEPPIQNRISKSYKDEDGTEEPFVEILARPSGSLNVTSRDLARLPLLMLGRGTLDGHTFLSQTSVERIERPETTDGARAGLKYGYGLGNLASPGKKALFYGHDGGIDGFVSKYEYAPGLGVGFVVMANLGKSEVQKVGTEIKDYLERNLPDPQVKGIPITADEIEKYSGIYATLTPRQQKMAFLESFFAWFQVKVVDGKLNFNDAARVSLGHGLFQRVDRPIPTIVFTEADGETRMYTAGEADRKMPNWEIAWKLAYGGTAAFAIALSALFMIVWIPSAFLGRLSERGGITIRLLPWLAMVSLLTFAVMTLIIMSQGGLDIVGKPTPQSWTIYALSLAVPAFGILSFVRTIMGAPDANVVVRFIAWINSLVVLGFAAYMWSFGWVGMKTWE